jgi:hypothetical protein
MTSGTAAFDATASDRGAGAWHGAEGVRDEARRAPPAATWKARFAEFMLVGGATLFLFPLSWLARRFVGLDPSEYAIGFATFYGAYVINDPHFAVTYLLFYKDVRQRALGAGYPLAQRIRYLVAGFAVPVILVAWGAFAIATRAADRLGFMVQLMYFLVGWHYVKQGFGVLAVLSARRGVVLTARERTVILTHCFAGWAYAWASPAAPAGDFEEKGVVYRALAHPRSLEIATGIVLIGSAIALAFVLFQRWRRERRVLPVAPLLGLLVTVWSWTIYSSADRLVQYVIPALHSIQYLYFVGLMKRNEARASEGPPSFGRPPAVRIAALAISALALGWIFFHGAPALFDAIRAPRGNRHVVTDALGPTPFFAALFVIVNIHHYFMDHVIWRRENPDTRFLRDPVMTSGI